MRCSENLSPDEIRKRVKRARCFEDSRIYEGAFYLRKIDEDRLYLHYGFSSLVHFAECEVGLNSRQVRERVRVMKALDGLRKIRAVFRRGWLCFTAVREITRIATPSTEKDWIRAALEHSVRDLERLVAASKDGQVPAKPRFGLPRNMMTLSLKLTPEQMALVNAVTEEFALENDCPADTAQAVMRALEVARESATSKDKVPNKNKRSSRTELVYIQCRECREGAVSTGEGFVHSPAHVIEEIAANAKVRDATSPVPDEADTDEFTSTIDTPEAPSEELSLIHI